MASGADAVITGNWGADMLNLGKSLTEAGYKGPIYCYYCFGVGITSVFGEKGVGMLKAVGEGFHNPAPSDEFRQFHKRFKAKYSLQDRINYTCPIKNYLFKKTGGIISGCVQTHLAEASISLFNDIDLFMTFGDEQYSKILSTSLGSRIEKSVPVGSIRVESYLNKTSREFNYDQEIDILVFGVNIYNWLYLNNESKKNYYMFLNYVSSISKNYKDLKIVFKHHPNNIEDKKEIEIMKSSNVIYLDKKINSYSLIKNSKLFLSYSSTMIIETSGIVGKSYFIDPYNSNNVFFNENKNYEKIKLVKPSEIDETINSIILKKDKPKKMLNNICFESKNVSELIVKNLKGL